MKPGILISATADQESALLELLRRQRALVSRFCWIVEGSLAAHLPPHPRLTVKTVASRAEWHAQLFEDSTQAVIALWDPAADPAGLAKLVQDCQEANLPLALNVPTARALLLSLVEQRLGYLIFNPIAGQEDETQQLALVRQRLSAGIRLQVLLTEPERDAKSLAEEALAARPDLIIASGGDGTVSAVAGVLFGSGIPLGVIPRGTANAFAAALGIPTDLERACDLILAGSTRVMDAARCDGQPLILLAGIGFEAETVERASRELKARLGPLAYLLAGLQQLANQQPFQVTLQVDGGEPQHLQATALTVIAPPVRKPNSAEKLAIFWVRRVSPSLTLLSATVGLGGILGSALALWGLTLALQGLAPSSQAIDVWILQWLQRASPWLDPLAWVGWGLGHPIGLVSLTACGWVLLWRSQQRRTAWGLLVAALGAAVIARILQPTFSRPRPDLRDPILAETGHSFPSGQVIAATAIYGLLGYLLARYYPTQRRWIGSGVLGILFLIGFSRAYLGLNWPSNLLAGYSLGALWFIFCITLLRIQWMRQTDGRRQVKPNSQQK